MRGSIAGGSRALEIRAAVEKSTLRNSKSAPSLICFDRDNKKRNHEPNSRFGFQREATPNLDTTQIQIEQKNQSKEKSSADSQGFKNESAFYKSILSLKKIGVLEKNESTEIQPKTRIEKLKRHVNYNGQSIRNLVKNKINITRYLREESGKS